MRVLCVTKIFPNARQPELAPYNRHQFRELARLCELRLWALLPWFPGSSLLERGKTPIPPVEQIDGLEVAHPRVLYLPRVGRGLSGLLYTASLVRQALPLKGQVDVVLGAFAYPDGWAAVALGQLLGVPAVVKLHGSDINRYGLDPSLRRHVSWALRRASAVVAPSKQLIDRAIELGADPERAQVIKNGVDKSAFTVRDRRECRAALGWPDDDRRWITFIGRVERHKGALDLLAAFPAVAAGRSDAKLVLVGDGDERAECERLARERSLDVSFVGARPPEEIPWWIGASDVVVLPSWAEGTPNVIIEAIASGRRVVASNVGGIPALVNDTVGELVPPRLPDRLAAALLRALATPYDPHAVARAVALDDWHDSARALERVLAGAAGSARDLRRAA